MRHAFIFTIFGLIAGALLSVFYILRTFDPTMFLAILIILLIGFITDAIFAVIFYFIGYRNIGLETERSLFRRGLKKGLFFGILVVLLLVIQLFFDII